MKLFVLVVVTCLLADYGQARGVEGQLRNGVYSSPRALFRIDIPVMHNPFIKEPAIIRDQRRDDGGEEVTFAVPDLGEAYRFGAFPGGATQTLEPLDLAEICDRELAGWTRLQQRPPALLEAPLEIAGRQGLVRIYYVEGASLLFRNQGSGISERESALIGVIVVAAPAQQHVLYMVGQFDMPNRGSFYTLDTEKGRYKLAAQHLKRMLELSASLTTPGTGR